MTSSEFKNRLNFLTSNTNEIGLVLYLILKTGDNYSIKKADIESNTQIEIRDRIIARLKNDWIDNSDFKIEPLSNGIINRDTAYYYDFDEKSEDLSDVINLITIRTQTLYNFNEDSMENISGMVYNIGHEDNYFSFYRKVYPISLLKRDRVFLIKKVDTRFEQVAEDMLKIDDNFDFMVADNEIIVKNVTVLEKFLGLEQVIMQQASANIQIIENLNFVENIEPLKNAAQDIKYAKKVVKLKRNSPVFELPFNTIKSFIMAHPKLKRRIRLNSNGTKIALDTKVSIDLFIKLLDDDFLKSDLTKLNYDSIIKQELEIGDEPE